ncbi:MAG: hypothetical protein ND866_22855 [Pyrinomonadaceae bacterium]|nr:hypothetical protein [Pyrinomonadaceae bacterium]
MNKRLKLCANAWLWLLLVNFTGAQAQTPNVSTAPSANRPVKGSGTAGQLPKWTSSDTIGDSIVVESNGNIGIGTATPGSKLTVAGRIEAFTTGFIPAVLGQSPAGAGVRGNSDSGFGVFGSSTTGNGAQGLSNSGNGLFGFSLTGNGVRGDTSNASTAGVLGFNNASGGTGVLGQAFFGTGVRGISSSSFGVFGSSDTFTAVEARSNTGFGVFGSSNTNTGVHGQSNTGTGVFGSTGAGQGFGVRGFNSTGGTAVLGEAPNGTGVVGASNSDLGSGVLGLNSGGGDAIRGQSQGGVSVFGLSDTGFGVLGLSDSGTGVFGVGNGGPAGAFNGDVNVSGTLTKGGGSFKIDHPLDPANKTLSHSFVESPDMMNIYNGNITTDDNGESTVLLPDYFAALNKDFRYQLTVIGQFAQAIVASEISDNRFQIKTDKPTVKVSWQVTGIRQDAWANKHRIPVDEQKPDRERGYYIHPELYEQPDEKNVEWARRPRLMKHVEEMKRTKLP